MSSGVYVLQLKDNLKYYVGKSENIDKRINTHKECGENCAKFVKINGGVNKVLAPLTPSDKNLSNWEKDETISRMIKHGYNNVRGWEFTRTNKLTKEELEKIILIEVPSKIYPELRKIFIFLFENSGFKEVKINETVDFEKLYKMKKFQ